MNKEYNGDTEVSLELPERETIECYYLSDVTTQKIEWLWLNRIPKATLTILEGDGGKGKSTIVADICSRLSNGSKLPDDETERSTYKVLLLSTEDDPSTVLKPRYEANNANLKNIIFSDQTLLLNEDGLRKLRNTILVKQINLVVIDPIVSFLGTKIDMNKSNNVRSVLGPLIEIARETNCTFLVIRHFNKSQECAVSHKGAGSVDFRNAARSVMQVHQGRDDSALFLTVEKSNYGVRAKSLPYSISDQKVIWGQPSDLLAEDIETIYYKSALDEAITFLKVELKVPRPAKEIMRSAREAGHSEKTTRRAATKIGVIKEKTSSYWEWSLNQNKMQDGQGDQDNQ